MTDSLLQHLTPDEVELWAQGLLPAARDTHLAQCAECRTIAERERKLIRELSQLTRFTRSEEHTSELQSPCNLVCRLLLEKKKEKNVNLQAKVMHKHTLVRG